MPGTSDTTKFEQSEIWQFQLRFVEMLIATLLTRRVVTRQAMLVCIARFAEDSDVRSLADAFGL